MNTNNQLLKKEYVDVLEKNDWTINYTGDGRVELSNFSPAGEDFVMCVEIENFPKAVAKYAENFDVDEHVETWIEAKQNGVSGVPSVRALVHDAENIDTMLQELTTALREKAMNLDNQLLEAARAGNVAKIEEALENGADIHAFGDGASQLAQANGHQDALKLLQDHLAKEAEKEASSKSLTDIVREKQSRARGKSQSHSRDIEPEYGD